MLKKDQIVKPVYRACKRCGWVGKVSRLQNPQTCGMANCNASGVELSPRFASKEDLINTLTSTLLGHGYEKVIEKIIESSDGRKPSHVISEAIKQAKKDKGIIEQRKADVEAVKAKNLSDEELGTTHVDSLFDSDGSITDSADPAIDETLLNPIVDEELDLSWTEDDERIEENMKRWDAQKRGD